MNITRSPIRNVSELTIDADVDFLDTYQVGSLASPAADEALRKGNKDIANAEVADAAAIDYSKLALTGEILMADLATAIKNAAAGLAVLDASADVPLAQIPDTLTGKDAGSVGGETKAELEATMDSKDAAAIAGLAALTVIAGVGTEVFDGTNPTGFTDLDLSGTIGAQATLVLLKVYTPDTQTAFVFRQNGDTEALSCSSAHFGCSGAYVVAAESGLAWVSTDTSGIVEWLGDAARANTTVDIVAYIK